ncbi:uncharacterized protein TRIADDRAFT_55534 [Trichoplax adhaerens]|uniref:Uncharacterized protein n=1 Tax=Trichoplax adhaerens TaxID=10228 RepID=B3RV57_TRIAD|nr:hypothetical protein TRIADDRAFT_55534 [Trichoplax adhaerens]EDV25443.1 hypothetical protein TRIADDRAFT_55534 [Trichoplax adhaerens]|eukprot:XP_002111476.1 hypothetical protein TRIADDRAFT_55534 [Trichoplax adhaerens]
MSRNWRGLSKRKSSAAGGQHEKIETPAEREFKNRNRKDKKKDGAGSKLSKLVHSLKPRTSFLSPNHNKEIQEKEKETVNEEIAEHQNAPSQSANRDDESPYARIRDLPNIKHGDSDNSDEDINNDSNQYAQRKLSFMSTRARQASPSNSGDEYDPGKIVPSSNTGSHPSRTSMISKNNNLNPDPMYATVNKNSNRMLKQLTVESNASDFTNVTSRISSDSSEESQSDEADGVRERGIIEKNRRNSGSPTKRDAILISNKTGNDPIDEKYADSETSEEAYTQPQVLPNQRVTTLVDKNKSKHGANSVDATPAENKKFGRKSSHSLTSSLSNFFSSALSGIHNDRNSVSSPVSRNPSQIFTDYDGRKRKGDAPTISTTNRGRHLRKSDSLEYNDFTIDSSPRMGMRGMESEIILSLERQIRDVESENKQLKDTNSMLQKELSNRSLPLAEENIKSELINSDLKQDNEFLKVLVHKLNQELERYKMKQAESETGSQDLLTEKINAEDKRLVEIKSRKKDHLLKTFSEEVKVLKEQIEDLVSENKALREELVTINATTAPVSISDWNQIQEQAQLVLQENSVLKDRQASSESNLQEITRKYAEQIDCLNQNIQDLKDKILEIESRPDKRNEMLLQKYEKLIAVSDKKIDTHEHLRIIEEKNRSMIELQTEYNKIITELKNDIQSEKREKRALTLQLIETTEAAEQLQKVVKLSRSEIGKSQKKIIVLSKKLDLAEEKAMLTTSNLADLLKVAEKTTFERDLIATKAKKHRENYEKAQRQVQEGHLEINKLEQKLRRYEITTYQKLDKAANKLAKQDMIHGEKFIEYQYEIDRLQELVKNKDVQLDSLLDQKWKVERQLDNLWYAATNDADRIPLKNQ